MSVINKESLVTQLQTVINGLNVSTETTENLLVYLKSAQLVGADASTIVTQLNTLISTIGTSAALEEAVLLTMAVSLLTTDRINTVSTVANLPSTASPGSVYFVESEKVPFIRKINGTWTVIDIYLNNKNTTWAWGLSNDGRLGDDTVSNRSSPVSVVGGFRDWVQVSAGGYHTAAIRANGTAWAWGRNSSGVLGDNTTSSRLSPVSVVGGFTDWVQIDAGRAHTAAIRANGTAWAWGNNNYGRLGDNTTSSRSSPVSVVGGFTDWVQISAGDYHTAAIRANGTAWAWGNNNYGRLGDNTTSSRSSPVSVVGGFTDWVQISAGRFHTAAIRANGTAWAWGYNTSGRLGDDTTLSRTSPVSVVGGFTDWVQISAGSLHTAAIRANGTAWAWGSNLNGVLGDNTTTSRSSPVSVVGGFTDWVQISIGNLTAAIRANGTAWAWGFNNAGRLGDGTATNRSSPVSVVGGFTDWVQISTNNAHIAALR